MNRDPKPVTDKYDYPEFQQDGWYREVPLVDPYLVASAGWSESRGCFFTFQDAETDTDACFNAGRILTALIRFAEDHAEDDTASLDAVIGLLQGALDEARLARLSALDRLPTPLAASEDLA